MRRCLAAAILLLALGASGARGAGDRVWAALVLATRENPPGRVPNALEEFAPTIRNVFGYNTFYLLGEKKRALYSGGEEWLVPSREFFLRVQCLSQSATFYTLRIELYRAKSLLLTAEAKLGRDAPLYIRGPEWGRGQLIFVLEVR